MMNDDRIGNRHGLLIFCLSVTRAQKTPLLLTVYDDFFIVVVVHSFSGGGVANYTEQQNLLVRI